MPIDPTHSASEYTTYIRQKADIVRNGALNFAGALFKSAVFTSSAGKQEFPPPPPPSGDYGILTGFSATKSLYYPGLNPGTSDFTIECFFRSPVINGRYLWRFDGNTDIRLNYDGLIARIDDDDGHEISSPDIDTWYHVAMTRSGNNWYAMFNGVNSLFDTGEFSLSGGSLIVGSSSPDDDGSNSFRGSISNFRYTKRALYTTAGSYTIPSLPLQNIADTELLLLAQPGAPLADSSDNNYVAQGTCDWLPGPISV